MESVRICFSTYQVLSYRQHTTLKDARNLKSVSRAKLHDLKSILEQRQYKNDSIQSKIIPILKLARFSPHFIGGKKERQFQSWNYFRLNGVVLILS